MLGTLSTHQKRLLLFTATTGYQTEQFRQAAERLGIEVILATDRCHVLDDPWGDRAVAVKFDERGPEALRALAERGPFDGLVALGDRPTELAAQAAEAFRLRYSPVGAVRAARSKDLTKQRLLAAGVRTARPVEQEFPCVVKPLTESASRGVIRCNDAGELARASERIRTMLEERRARLLVEEYVPGGEFALEGLLTGGELQVLAIFDKPDPLEGPFFEESIYVTPSRENAPAQEAIVVEIRKAIAALGLRDGPVHAEARANESGVWVLEVAPRPIGGLCARALRFAGGAGLEEIVIRHALGEKIPKLALDAGARGVMMIPVPRSGILEEVEGVEEAARIPGIEEILITAKPGERLIPWPEGKSYPGFLFSVGDTPAEAERALREAHARLRFRMAVTLPVLH